MGNRLLQNLNPRRSVFRMKQTWQWFFVLLTISVTNSFPNPKPFLLVNRGEINIHDSVQRIGHSHLKSTGGRVHYWRVGGDDEGPEARSMDASRGMSIHADSGLVNDPNFAVVGKDSDPGFQPSRFQYLAQNQNQPSYQQQSQQYAQQNHDGYTTSASTQTQHFTATADAYAMNQPNQNSGHVQAANGQSPLKGLTQAQYDVTPAHQQHQSNNYQPYRNQPGLGNMIRGFRGKVNNAFRNVRQTLKSMIFKRMNPRPPTIQIPKVVGSSGGTGSGYNRRSTIFGMDFWNVDSPLARIVRWVNNAMTPRSGFDY